MSTIFDSRISALSAAGIRNCLSGGFKGIEKESLRVAADGLLSRRPHPEALGSALTNPYITTDFSEALLEFVTPAFPSTWEALQSLCDIHQFTYARLGDELLWVTSMPCAIRPGEEVPLARYGNSNVGRMKTVYRNGLGYRYGRNMQTIAGIHFNYSLPIDFWPLYREIEGDSGPDDHFRSEAYFGLVRNFRRFGWLVLYLFGASPALCRSFLGGADNGMPTIDGDTLYQPFATSLRMSDLGYSNSTQARINISLNSLDEYVNDLTAAIATPEPRFEKIGTIVDGEYRQLSVNRLQIENEYYSAVRPKRVAMSGERPTTALMRGGVEYVEIRSLDINAFDPVGINQNAMRFIEAFLVYCLLEESPTFDDSVYDEIASNQSLTATAGRDPQLMLSRDGRAVRLTGWAEQILRNVATVAELLDDGDDVKHYGSAVAAQRHLVEDPSLTPSARILKDLQDLNLGFFAYGLQAARNHKAYFAELEPLSGPRLEILSSQARDSLLRQAEIEAADSLSFEDYLAQYYAG